MPVVAPAIFQRVFQSSLTASARAGATVTASATAHTMGSWASLIDPTNVPSYGIYVVVRDISGAAADTRFLIDIGIGPSGGGSEAVVLPFLDVGAADSATNALGKQWYFPIYIPTGLRVSARGQAVTGSDTCTVAIWLAQQPLFPYLVSAWDTYGENAAASSGTSVTAGNGVFGSWTQIVASTSRFHNLWHSGYSIGTDTTIVAADTLVEIGHGPDSANVQSIGMWRYRQNASEALDGPMPEIPLYKPVPSGAGLFARIASAEAEARRVVIHAGLAA
jgi:hypothetical protein